MNEQKKQKFLLGLLVILIVGLGGYWFAMASPKESVAVTSTEASIGRTKLNPQADDDRSKRGKGRSKNPTPVTDDAAKNTRTGLETTDEEERIERNRSGRNKGPKEAKNEPKPVA